MDLLKSLFPYSFKPKAGVGAVIVNVIVYLLVSTVLGWAAGLLPLIGGIIGWVIGLYCTVGWILTILDYMKILK